MQNQISPSASTSDPVVPAVVPVDELLANCAFTQPTPGCTMVRISGELDACSVPALEEQIRSGVDPQCPRLVMDLRDVGFIDSTGIRLLVQLLGSAEARRSMVIVKPRSRVACRAMEVVGLPRIVQMVDGVEEIGKL